MNGKAALQIPTFEKKAYVEPTGPVEAAGNIVRFAENVTKSAFNQVIGAANVALNEGADIADQGLSQWGMQKFHQLSELPNNVIRTLGEDFQNLGRDLQSVGAWENAFASALLLFAGSAQSIKSLLTPRIAGQGAKSLTLSNILADETLLTGRTPSEVRRALGDLPGWREGALGRGKSAGQGWVLREIAPNGEPTGRMLRYSPGSTHHPEVGPYWRVNPGKGQGGVIPGGVE